MRNAERNFTIILLLYDTAIRVGELAGLTLDQVDFDGGWLRIRGKGAKERIVPMGATSRRALWRCVNEARPEPAVPAIDNVFVNERREPITRDAYRVPRPADHVSRSLLTSCVRSCCGQTKRNGP